MKFDFGVLPADHPDVLAALHRMRETAPSAAAALKVELGHMGRPSASPCATFWRLIPASWIIAHLPRKPCKHRTRRLPA